MALRARRSLLPGATALAYDRHRPPARGRKAKGNGLGPAAGAARGLYSHLVADRARAALARAARDPRPAGGALGARRAGAARWRAAADAGPSGRVARAGPSRPNPADPRP